jgi:antitoxin component of RelBE/YafQ-DinJ toxin-antitoxin module
MADTNAQFDIVAAQCRSVFSKKLHDYGPAWRILRPQSVTDQIFIKANRIRSLETKGASKVDEGIRPEFMGIINYGAVGLIQLELGTADQMDITVDDALRMYDQKIAQAKSLMLDKNHDYDEAWRTMRISSYTDLILMKLHRTKQMEDLGGVTLVSEGIDANYLDMMNYAIFGLIRMEFDEK